jgi:hypothetical protein
MDSPHDPTLSKDSMCFDQELPWKFRVVRASVTDSRVLPLVFAILNVLPKFGPCYGDTATIGKDSNLYVHVRDADGHWSKVPMMIGSLIVARDSLRRVADHCKLKDADREAFIEEFRKWASKDKRATSGLDVKKHN